MVLVVIGRKKPNYSDELYEDGQNDDKKKNKFDDGYNENSFIEIWDLENKKLLCS